MGGASKGSVASTGRSADSWTLPMHYTPCASTALPQGSLRSDRTGFVCSLRRTMTQRRQPQRKQHHQSLPRKQQQNGQDCGAPVYKRPCGSKVTSCMAPWYIRPRPPPQGTSSRVLVGDKGRR